MTHVYPTRALLASALLLLLPGLSSADEPIPFEVGIAAREAGHLRALLARIDKQNVLYQYHLGDITKQQMSETASEIDRVIATLEQGSPVYSVAPPVTKEIREQLRAFDDEWGKLRRLALASPYEYLRYASDLMPKRSRLGDPLSIKLFSEMTTVAIAEAAKLQNMILDECNATGYEFCEAARQSGAFNMRVQRVARDLVLAYAGVEKDSSLLDLKQTTKELEENLESLATSPILTGAMAASRGRSAEFVGGLWNAIQAGWATLRFEIDLALDGQVEGLDIQRMLKAQRDLVDDLDRIRAALSRYAQAQLEA